jgi:hypothetical protein
VLDFGPRGVGGRMWLRSGGGGGVPRLPSPATGTRRQGTRRARVLWWPPLERPDEERRAQWWCVLRRRGKKRRGG